MKLKPSLLIVLCISISCLAAYVPTPEMAMALPTAKDSIKWVPQHMDGNETGIIFELVPEGQSIKKWKEMVAQQITFSKGSLTTHVSKWKAMVRKGDPNVQIKREKKDGNSILIIYRSNSFNEFCVRKFIHAKDGVYAIAYHVRLDCLEEDRVKMWIKLIENVELIPNPEKNR